MNNLFSKIGIALLWLILPTWALALGSELTTPQVIANTLQGTSSCLRYKVTGMCFWLRCETFGCHIETTLRLDHYLPDTVVTVYKHKDDNPWLFANTILDPAAFIAGNASMKAFTGFDMKDGDEHQRSNKDVHNRFHEVDIIGNPALAILDQQQLLLPSTAAAFVPYYSSLLDAYAWRNIALEFLNPETWAPYLRDVGTPIIGDWGQIFPRNGYINQPDDAKAGAVIAQRAAEIVAASGAPHLYQELTNSCGDHCDVDPIKENDHNTEFQMIYPKVESQCVVFGGSDAASLRPWGADAAMQGHGRYVWIMWRHYHGCVPDAGAKYLGQI